MPKVTILPHPTLCPEGKELANVKVGKSLCDLLLENDIEEDLLDQAWGLEATSRLSCQAQVGEQDLVVEIPKYTINHAREHH